MRLLRLLELDEQLVNALLDWLDADIEVRFPQGAEDDTYLGREPPYRAANAPLTDISELRLVAGFTAEVIDRLRPYVTALPETTELNVNTAPALVLATLAEGMSLAEVESLVQERDEEPFADLETFKAHQAFAGRELPGVGLALRSRYFRLHGTVQVGRAQLWLNSLLHRADDQQVGLVARSRELPAPGG
jgi:general secretion pathway protein K